MSTSTPSIPPLPPEDRAFLEAFLTSVHWQFARTYVRTYPHEYTLKKWCEPADHARLIALIERHGRVEPFYSARRKYLYCGERKLWHMGNPESPDPRGHPDVINRTWLDVARYRPQAEELGVTGTELDELIGTWRALLARARGERAPRSPRHGGNDR